MNKSLSDLLLDSGIIAQCSDVDLLVDCISSGSGFYLGIDLTGDKLHVGHLVPIRLAQILMRYGCKPYFLLGSATSRIGDPTGRNSARNVMPEDVIAFNKSGIKSNLTAILGDAPEFIDNYDWFKDISFIDFLSNIGKYISISKMFNQSTIQSRLKHNHHMSLSEFCYPALQGFDFAYLSYYKNCKIQIGGSDQWGNMVQGLDMAHKMYDSDTVVVTTPLILDSSGKKIGKSDGSTVWLDRNATSPFDLWQFWRNIDDQSARQYYDIFSDQYATFDDINQLKVELATNICTMVHGKKVAQNARETAERIFSSECLDINSAAGMLKFTICIDDFPQQVRQTGISLVDLLFEYELVPSRSQAKRLIRDSGVSVNRALVEMVDSALPLDQKGVFTVKIGKKRIIVFEVV